MKNRNKLCTLKKKKICIKAKRYKYEHAYKLTYNCKPITPDNMMSILHFNTNMDGNKIILQLTTNKYF